MTEQTIQEWKTCGSAQRTKRQLEAAGFSKSEYSVWIGRTQSKVRLNCPLEKKIALLPKMLEVGLDVYVSQVFGEVRDVIPHVQPWNRVGQPGRLI